MEAQSYYYTSNIRTSDGKVTKPSKKIFERQCKQLADEIHVVHTKLADNKAQLNELFGKLDKLRQHKNGKFAEKNAVEGTVKDMSGNVNKLSERLSQLQSKLHYRDMKKLEDAIRKLQLHLDSRHFKHSEEKKIVAEIDKLNRSKKVVGEYLDAQSELKSLRRSQHNKRADRDKLIKDIASIRKEEDDTRGKITTHKEIELQLRSDLDAINTNKKSLKEQYAKHQQMYEEQKSAMKQADTESRQRQANQQQCRLTRSLQKCHFSGDQSNNSSIAQTQEMIHCQQLIEFCQRITKQHVDEKAVQRQKKLNKKISYTPDLLSQFVSLEVLPPITIAQACDTLPLLQQKLVELNSLNVVKVDTDTDDVIQSKDSDVTSSSSVINGDDLTTDTKAEPCQDYVREIPVIDEELAIDTEQPDDQSDKSSLTKQLSHTSDEEAIESITYKLALLDSLSLIEDMKASDNFIS